ncbi:MAG TPA: ABC transporter ATP-binding protein [Thermoanaerobaculia bacterium]|nr:ABC transporter ATP-binding protein [Thermoanaerobaculia bacterium]
MTSAIVVQNLVKQYGSKEALSGLTFSVSEGSIYGLIGANGAGKTTTLSILAGLLRASSGDASIFGQTVGFHSAQFDLLDYLTGREILITQGRLHDVAPAELKQRVGDLLELFDLHRAGENYIYEYSQGMRQKLGLAMALVHSPRVILLDEPFDGLDATAVFRLIETLRSMVRNGKTVLLTSHDLALVERICDRVGVLHGGRIERELDLQPRDSQSARDDGSLESALWKIVGSPDYRELSWL